MGIYVIYGPKRKWLINHLLSFEPSFQYGSKLKNGQYGNCFLRYRIKFFKTVGHYHWAYQITLHWSQKHEQKRLYMAHLHPYATRGAGIWNPTFALVQNHSQSFFQYTSTMGNAYGTQVCFWMTCSVYGIAAGKLVLSLVNFVVLMRGNMSPNRNIAKIH